MKLRCPDCRKTFPWAPETKWPEFCPLCGNDISHDNDDKIVMPFVTSTGSVHSYDKLYRDMEKGSEFRAQMAASELGVPVSEVSHLKLTNMRDNPKEGETSHIPIQNEVTRHMDMLKAKGAQMGFQSNGAEYSPAVQSGPYPNMGAKMRTTIHNRHEQLSGGAAVSNMPALETLQPGYRIRG